MKSRHTHSTEVRRAFTLIEIIVVLGIMALLASILGVTIANMGESAREAQTIATLRKLNGLIEERRGGIIRSTKEPEFRRIVKVLHRRFINGDPTNGLPRLPRISEKAVEILTQKALMRASFPQYFQDIVDPTPSSPSVVLTRIQNDPVVNGSLDLTKHQRQTESAEVLYYTLTRMEAFGFPPVGNDEFLTSEVADTDGDGLPEFVDGWGNPIRFYRAPTRLIKPYGILSLDNVPGSAGNDDSAVEATPHAESLSEVGFRGSDDLQIQKEWRRFASLFITALPREPFYPGQYDLLNEDPDDPFGLLQQEFETLNAFQILTVADYAAMELNVHPLWAFPTPDTWHAPLLVSAGGDGVLGLLEPFPTEDFDGNGSLDPGEDLNGNGVIDLYGHLAIPATVTPHPLPGDPPSPVAAPAGPHIQESAFEAAADNITNRNRAAGG